MNDEPILIGALKPKETVRVEIARSFSFKLNVGNYESRDFFCSQKSECAIEHSEIVSQSLHDFCKSQVMKAVREWREANQALPIHQYPAPKANAAEFERRELAKPTDDYNRLKERIR